MKLKPVILCGGGGTRLWPLSTRNRPKPFVPLIGKQSLFEITLDRCSNNNLFEPPMIVTGESHLELVEQQSCWRKNVDIITEPSSKNTAAAIALAAFSLDEDCLMLVCPSDHSILDTPPFLQAAQSAMALAQDNYLVAISVEPDSPHTGYGYIETGEALGANQFKIKKFVEKPDLHTAKTFLGTGGFYWNAGIFCFKVSTFKQQLKEFRPNLYNLVLESVFTGSRKGNVSRPNKALFAKIESESIDYALMENTSLAATVTARMGWSDIGDWASLCKHLPTDLDGNFANCSTDLIECQNVQIFSNHCRVSMIGCNDLIVIAQGNELLILNPKDAQRVKDLRGAISQ